MPTTDSARRLSLSSDYDENASMMRVKMTALRSSQHLRDELDTSQGFLPRPIRFSAVLATPPVEDWMPLHRILEKENAGKKHWLENTARFTPAEMAAGMDGINNELLAAYTIAFLYMTNEQASKVCKDGGIVVKDAVSGFTVSL